MEITQTTLNKACKDLLDQLPDGVGSLVEAMAKERGIPLWHCTCGILLEVHTEGRLSAITIDPAWKQGFRQKELICAQCKNPFKPIRLNQVYCCNNCGEIVEYEQRLAKLPKHAKPKTNKDVKAIEDYEAELKYHNELKEIIQILKGVQEKPESIEPVKRESHGSDLGGKKRDMDSDAVNMDGGWVDASGNPPPPGKTGKRTKSAPIEAGVE